MKDQIRQNKRAIVIRTVAIFALSITGILIGIALALVVAQALGQSCSDDGDCQAGLYAFLGGVALTQGVNLIVIFALCRHLRQHKRTN